VIEKTQTFEAKLPKSSRIPEVLNLKGLALLISHRASDAVTAFRQATDRAPDAFAGDRNWKSYVRYNLAAALLESGSPQATLEELKLIDPDTLDTLNKGKFFQLRAKALGQSGRHFFAARQWVELSLQSEALDLSRVPFESAIQPALSRVEDLTELEELLEIAQKSVLAPVVLARLIRRESDIGKTASAQAHSLEFAKAYPNHPLTSEIANWNPTSAEISGPAQATIGLLVPQTGRFARFGERVIRAVSLALGVYDTSVDNKIQLVIEDAGEDPETALRALDRLYRVHQVGAVIGPILSKGAEQLVARAEAYHLPLVSLAQQGGSFGDYATQGAVTPRLQAEEIAKYAVQTMGYKNFAILSPKDRFGEEYSHEFWTAVEKLGGTIKAYETYEPGETDFRQSLDRLSGTFYKDSRSRELEAMAKDRDLNKIKKRSRKTEKYFALTPVVSFDAVFIPDEPKSVGLALPTFTYRDIDGVKFLGISAWNSVEMLQRAQKAAEGALFVDSYFALSASPLVRRFGERFRLAFGQEASGLEAVAFDAAGVVEKAITAEMSGGVVDHTRVAARIRQTNGAAGVTGTLSIKDGYWGRDLKVLTISDQQVVEASRARSARPAD